MVDLVDSFGRGIAAGIEGGFGLAFGVDENVVVGFVDEFVLIVLDKLADVAEIDLDETGFGGLCLETATGYCEGRFGQEEVGVGLDNVVVAFVDEFGGFDLEKHFDAAEFVLDDHGIGGVDEHGVHVGILYLEHVSSPCSSP